MSSPKPFPDLQAAREEAASWIARRERGLDPAECGEFERWVARPAHARAYRQLDGLWNEMDMLEALAQLVPEPPGKVPVASAAPRRRGLLAASIAAGLVGLAALVAWRLMPQTPRALAMPRIEAFASAVGEHRSVTLADRSVVTLNTDSLIEVSLGGNTRELRLVRGEAHFAVAHDAIKPFRVTAEGRVVQAIGTAFDVRLRDRHAVDVLVTEGLVSVDDAPRNPAEDPPVADMPSMHVKAGQQLKVDAAGQPALRQLGSRDVESAMAWRSGRLVFDGETLQQVLEEFERYTPERFEIRDAALGRTRIGGYFPAGDVQALRASLASGFGLVLHRQANGVLQVERQR